MGASAFAEALLGPRLTMDEWAGLPEDVPGEFLSGRLVEEEAPDYIHELLVAWLVRILGNWGEPRGALVAGSDVRFAVTANSGRKPDVTMFLAGRRPQPRGIVRTPPDLAVEVISGSPRDQQRDRQEKMHEYAVFGVAYYWLVDPEQRSFEVYQLTASGAYDRALVCSTGVVSSPPGCDALALDLDAMWAKVDELEAGAH
jgi:Uma2 family endonuclease